MRSTMEKVEADADNPFTAKANNCCDATRCPKGGTKPCLIKMDPVTVTPQFMFVNLGSGTVGVVYFVTVKARASCECAEKTG